jgi:hypothetical protein
MQLCAASIYIRVCGDQVEVSISPLWDNIGRHEYVAIGTVDEVLEELRKLAEDIQRVSRAIEDMYTGARNRGGDGC